MLPFEEKKQKVSAPVTVGKNEIPRWWWWRSGGTRLNWPRLIWIRFDEGLALETSSFESLYGGQFTLSTQLIKPIFFAILSPTKHHNFIRDLPPLSLYNVNSALHSPFVWRFSLSRGSNTVTQMGVWEEDDRSLYQRNFDAVYTAPKELENAAFFLRFGLPSTLWIRHEIGTFFENFGLAF